MTKVIGLAALASLAITLAVYSCTEARGAELEVRDRSGRVTHWVKRDPVYGNLVVRDRSGRVIATVRERGRNGAPLRAPRGSRHR